MTTPTDADTAAARELERLLEAVTGSHPQAKNNIRNFVELALAQARRDGAAGARTPGTVEVCSVCWIAPDKPCGSASAYTQETGDGCPIRSRTASEGRE